MRFLLSASRRIDAINETVGTLVSWLLLLAVLICTGNAAIRYAFNTSNNAWLEIQWYLYAAVFLLGASYTLRRNEHVRIDVVSGKLPQRVQAWIDVFGFAFFLLPMTLIILYYAVPYALLSIESGEMSTNAGGLIVWPAKVLIPIGFLLLTLQGVSELIKRIAFLRGLIDASVFERRSSAENEAADAVQPAHIPH
ncbi:MAG: TRAP transporter small permease subunit [Burkholderiaceae bacterium]